VAGPFKAITHAVKKPGQQGTMAAILAYTPPEDINTQTHTQKRTEHNSLLRETLLPSHFPLPFGSLSLS